MRVHILGIGGTAMSALAGLFRARGDEVTGSDGAPVYPPVSDQLARLGVPVRVGYAPGNLPEGLSAERDLVVIGNVITRENPEARAAMEQGLKCVSFPQALRERFLDGRAPVVVAGTHGKTTSSALMAWTYEVAGLAPSFLIGGVPLNFGVNARLGSGRVFVVEGDEYDTAFFDKGPKFLHYAPRTALVTNVEFDHADIYKSVEEVKEAFAKFLALIPPEGLLVAGLDSPHLEHLLGRAKGRVETFGLREGAGWRADDIESAPEGTSFVLYRKGDRIDQFRVPLFGRHNVANAAGVATTALLEGIPLGKVREALSTFAGVRRRQEHAGSAGGVDVLDDFAHHPTAVRETIAAVRSRYPNRRLWAVFEPRSNTSRRNVFQGDYPKALSGADRILLAGVYHAEKIPSEERLDPARVASDLTAAKKAAECLPTPEAIAERVVGEAREGDVVLVMSNGPFGGVVGKILKGLQERGESRPLPLVERSVGKAGG